MGVKVDFDTGNRLVIVTETPVIAAGDTISQQTIDVEIDLYSDAKEDWKANIGGNKRKSILPFSTAESAGAELPGGQVEPAFFRFRNDLGWRLLPYDSDHELTLIGNIVPADPALPIFAKRTGRTILIFRDGSQVAQLTSKTAAEAIWTDTRATAFIADISTIKGIESGDWELVGDQMIFKDTLGNEVARFNMFDQSGNPTTTGEIYKRVKV